MNGKNEMKIAFAALVACVMFLGQTGVGNSCSIDTRSTYPTAHCQPPTYVKATSNPLACTNTYVMAGTCVQNRKDLAKNYQPTYRVTAVWNGYTQQATETLEFHDVLYREYETVKGQVVSKCSNDPWMNDVKCASGPLKWIGSGAPVKIHGSFPLTPGHINRAAVRKQLLSNSVGPVIAAPREYQKFVNPKGVLVVVKAALPCGIGANATSAVLMIQKEKDVATAAKGWKNVTWVDWGTRKFQVRNNGGLVRLTGLTPGTWRVKAEVISPNVGPSGDWRYFQVNLHINPGNFHMKLQPKSN